MRDAVKRLRKEVEADLAAAEQDNCRIYYARVPTAAALAELPGLPQQLVRPTAVEKILERGAVDKAPAPAAAPRTHTIRGHSRGTHHRPPTPLR